MLDPGKVLRYIKRQLGHPVLPLEMEDDQILEFVREFTLQEFSSYVPDKKHVVVDPSDSNQRDPLVKNRFFIHDPDDCEILNVVDINWGWGDTEIFYGHPPYGALSYDALPEWALAVEKARNLKLFGAFNDYTYHFIHPNQIEVIPDPSAPFRVNYERQHPPDFGTIPLQMERYFLDLALADIKIQLGNIRKRYSEISTPFGTIPVNAEIGDEGKELKEKVIEKLQTVVPNVVIDIG